MSKSYEIIADSRDPESWHAARRLGIGASEAASLLGKSPWKSLLQLYAEKTGAAEPPNLDDVELVDWGKRLEWVIAEAYRDRTKRFVDRGGKLLRSKRYPWAIATLDAWTALEELGPYWPLEVKTAGVGKADEWLDGPPEHYRIQVHWQMLVTDVHVATVACLIGGQKLVWCDVERDEALIRRLVFHGEEFARRVEQRDPPTPDATESARRAIGALYPRDDGETIALGAEFIDVADEIEIVKREEKALSLRKAAAENALRMAIGPKRCGVLPDGRVATLSTVSKKAYEVKASTTRVLRISQAKE